jgi:hypothetical protein
MALSGDGGKGHGRRPQLAPNDVVESNWEKIFGTKKPKPSNKKQPHKENINAIPLDRKI